MSKVNSHIRSKICKFSSSLTEGCTHTLNKFVFSLTHVGTPWRKMGHLEEKLTKDGASDSKGPPNLYAQQFSMSTRTLNKFVFSHTRRDPLTNMGHLDEKLTTDGASWHPSVMLSSTVWVHTLNKFVFPCIHVGIPRQKMGHLEEKLTKDGASWQQISL